MARIFHRAFTKFLPSLSSGDFTIGGDMSFGLHIDRILSNITQDQLKAINKENERIVEWTGTIELKTTESTVIANF